MFKFFVIPCWNSAVSTGFTTCSVVTFEYPATLQVLHGLKAVVLGSYYNKDAGLEFTPAAKQFDEACSGKLSNLALK